MFLLLKNNKIIDVEKQNCKPDGLHNGKETYIYDVIHWFYKEDIIKESKNVSRLLKDGDLVEYKNHRGHHFRLVEGRCVSIDDSSIMFINNNYSNSIYDANFITIYDEEVVAIYKLNSNGDYIKVWKR